MTHLSSTRRPINSTSFKTLIVWTLPSGSQWRTTRRMVPSPSWTALSNQRLIVAYPSLCTGNLHIQTSTYSGIAIITFQPNSVSSIPSPIGPQTVCSSPGLLQQEMGHLRKALTQCKYPKWALDKVEKMLNKSTSEATDGVNKQGTTGTQAVTNEVKPKGHIVIPTHQGFVKVSRGSVVDMAFKPTSKVAAPSRTSWSPPRTKTLWSNRVMPYTGTSVGT